MLLAKISCAFFQKEEHVISKNILHLYLNIVFSWIVVLILFNTYACLSLVTFFLTFVGKEYRHCPYFVVL